MIPSTQRRPGTMGKKARKKRTSGYPEIAKLSVGQAVPADYDLPNRQIQRKTRNGIVEEWRVEAPLPQDRLIPLETLRKKNNQRGKNKSYLKMISKLRKQRRLNNYASVYSMRIKETLSPRSPETADLNRTLKSLRNKTQ